MKFLLVKALAENHLYSEFVDALLGGLQEIGQQAAVINQAFGSVDDLAREIETSKHDVVVSFGSVFGDAHKTTGKSIFDNAGVKFLGWQLDHPIYLHHFLSKEMENRFSVYSNFNHRRFAEAVKVRGKSLSMLSGGSRHTERLNGYKAREWSVFIAAGWGGEPERPWTTLEDSPAKRLLEEITERLMNDPEVSVLDAFNKASDALKLGARLGMDADLDREIIKLLRLALDYVRKADRLNIIGHLIKAGVPITICGAGWREHFGERKNVTFLEQNVDFKDMPHMYNNAKIALNLNAGNGGCERAIYAMMAGCAVVSEFSRDLAQSFKASEEIAFFNRTCPIEVVGTVERLLDSGDGETVAQRGYEQAMQTALWRHRAEKLVAFLS
jgi:hypothetical protein